MTSITLKKCAYIFHASNNTYFYGSKADLEKKHAINKLLKNLYEPNANRTFNASDSDIGYIININGYMIAVNNQMLLSVNDDSETAKILNNISRKTFENIDPKHFRINIANDTTWIYSKQFKSLGCEEFMGADTLGYYRLSFNRSKITFVVSDHKLFTPSLKPLTYDNITALADSKKAKKEITAILDYLTE